MHFTLAQLHGKAQKLLKRREEQLRLSVSRWQKLQNESSGCWSLEKLLIHLDLDLGVPIDGVGSSFAAHSFRFRFRSPEKLRRVVIRCSFN